jgi:hypothetical protein
VGVLASVEYARVWEKHTGCDARLFVVESPQGVMAAPFFLRPVRTLPFASTLADERWDAFTPHYTGPMVVAGEPGSGSGSYSTLFAEYCRQNRIIAEFAHLNPWHAREECLERSCIVPNRELVYVDLTWTPEQIWSKSFSSDCRRQMNRARDAKVVVRRAESAADVAAFHRLHTDTMDRRQAQDKYYHAPDDFQEFFEQLPKNCFIQLAEYDNQLVAASLFFHDRHDLYWDLSSVDLKFAHARPVYAIVRDAIQWGSAAGKKRMLLGGGYQFGDGVFRFKTNFSPLRVHFAIYKRIHDESAYAALTRAWSAHHNGAQPSEFFPAYRSVVQEPVAAEVS